MAAGRTDLFLSYAWGPEVGGRRALQEKALAVYAFLCREGYTVWLDTQRMAHAATDAGDLNDAMAMGISAASAVVVCISPSYASSGNCKLEHGYAKRRGKPLFYVNVGDAPKGGSDTRGWDPGVFDDSDAAAVNLYGWLEMAVGGALWADCRDAQRAVGPGGLAQLARSLGGNDRVRRSGAAAAAPPQAAPAASSGKEAEEEEEEAEGKEGEPAAGQPAAAAAAAAAVRTPAEGKEGQEGEGEGADSECALQASVGVAVAAMVSRGATPAAALHGCTALCALAHTAPGRDACVSAGAVSALVAVLEVHGAAAPHVAAVAAHALKNIASGSAHCKAACLEAAPSLVAVLRAHAGSSAEVAEQASRALKNIAGLGSAQAAQALGAAGAPAALLHALGAQGASPAVCAAACGALRNLAAGGSAECRAQCRGGAGAVLAVLAAHGGEGRVCEQACGALRGIFAGEEGGGTLQ